MPRLWAICFPYILGVAAFRPSSLRSVDSPSALQELRRQSVALQQELDTFETTLGEDASPQDRARERSLRLELAAIQKVVRRSADARRQKAAEEQGADQAVEGPGSGDDDTARSVVSPKRPRRPRHTARVLTRTLPAAVPVAAAQTGANVQDDKISVRPSAKDDEVDIVKFGLYAKTFYGLQMNAQTFTLDTVLTLVWNDPRTATLVPDGSDVLTLSAKDALKKIWMPEVVITNREIGKIEIISTSVSITKGGNVTKVERSLGVIKNKFDVKAFPFDKQDLLVKVASSKYMLDELKLEPLQDSNISGVNDDLFDGMGFKLVSFGTSEFEDIDGTLQKSRGVMKVTVERDISKYLQSHFLPSMLFVTISYGVFWFPYLSPKDQNAKAFITPRLALSILALLTFTTLSIKVEKMLPAGGPFSWNDLYNQNLQWLMFFTIVLNILTEIVTHGVKCEEIGMSMNTEIKLLWPIVLGSSLSVVFFDTTGETLKTQSIIATLLIVVPISLFIVFSMMRVLNKQAEDKADPLMHG